MLLFFIFESQPFIQNMNTLDTIIFDTVFMGKIPLICREILQFWFLNILFRLNKTWLRAGWVPFSQSGRWKQTRSPVTAQGLETGHQRKYYVLPLPLEKMSLLSSLKSFLFWLGKQLAFTFQTSKFIFEVKNYFPREQHEDLKEYEAKCEIYFPL